MRFIAVALALAALHAAPVQAADTVVSTVARPTTIDSYGGRAVWSAWDPSARAYRLTEYADGAVRQVPVPAGAVPFDVDLGPAASGAWPAPAVRPTNAGPPCGARAPRSPVPTRRARDAPGGSCTGDRWRAATPRGACRGAARRARSSTRRARPSSATPVHWALSVGGKEPSVSEIRRFDLTTGSDSRATMRVEGGGNTRWATEGFAQEGAGRSWYVRAAATDRYEVHVATGLSYEPAPPPRIG
jgi:hypothetical protein